MSVSNATVRFDVGGTVYRVSRSLLAQHPHTMLARMVSDAWLPQQRGETTTDNNDNGEQQQKPDAPLLFIDRNGERFQYVLDYMRDGKVFIPAGRVSKQAVVMDLEYYGFENLDVTWSCIAESRGVLDSVKLVHSVERQHLHETFCMKLAHVIFSKNRSTQRFELHVHRPDELYNEMGRELLGIYSGGPKHAKLETLNRCLAKFELECTQIIVCHGGSYAKITFQPLAA